MAVGRRSTYRSAIVTDLLYRCEFRLAVQVPAQVGLKASRRLEASLACTGCQRADRTILLSQTEPARHWGGSDDHEYPGRLAGFSLERQADLARVVYLLEYDFEPFVDAKYPEREVTPQPTWGRMALQLSCVCGHLRELETQCNLVKPMAEICGCGRLLFLETEGALQFSQASRF